MSSYLYQEARSNLEFILQEIVEDAKTEDNSSVKDSDETDTINSQDAKGSPSEAVTPKKLSTPKSTRKRKKKDDISKEDRQKQNACIMKLFDRQVDLASFDETTPLYPICRAWMDNDPLDKKRLCLEPPTIPEPSNTSNGNVITFMPKPDVPWKNTLRGKYRSPRIPSPLPKMDDSLERYIQKPTLAPAAEDLLLAHLDRWKSIRTKWLEKSRENEKRYATGMKMLVTMAKQHMYNSTSSS